MLDMNRIPAHVAIIMDGNGRWATKRNMPRVMGHNAGMKTLKGIAKRAAQIGVKYLTVYGFSTENWKRSEEEVSGIFKLLIKYVDTELDELHKNNVKVNILGDWSAMSDKVKEKLNLTVEKTKNNTGLQFNIALNYGSRAEIVHSVKAIAEKMYKENDMFYLGRGLDYAVALEGSLKLKEISYIHSEAYAGGELKHGPIALIEDGTQVITLLTQEALKEKMVSNVVEIKARGAKVTGICYEGTKGLEEVLDEIIYIPRTLDMFAPVLSVAVLQLISYYIAKARGCDIDKPRNLAKSVTVE